MRRSHKPVARLASTKQCPTGTMLEDDLNVWPLGLKVSVVRAQSTPLEGLACGSSGRVVVGFDCSPTTPSQPTTPRQRLPRSPLCSLLKEQEISMKRSLSINIGCTRLSPAIGAVLCPNRKARSSADLRGSLPDASSLANFSPASSLSRPSTPIPIPDSREYQLRPEAALLEDLSMEEAPGHLPGADTSMRASASPGGRSQCSDIQMEGSYVHVRPENAVRQLRCVEERLRQSPEQDSAWRMVMHLRVQEEERARLQSECEDMRTRSAVIPDLLDLLFEMDDAPPTPPPRPHVSRSATRHFGMPPRPPPTCQINRGFSVPHPTATAW